MICSARELGLGEDHAGIIVLSELGLDAPVGTDARELLGLGEEVLEINVTPDRGYCFSMRGVAREYGLSTGAAFTDHGLPHGRRAPRAAAASRSRSTTRPDPRGPGRRPLRRADRARRARERPVARVDAAPAAAGRHAADQPGRRRHQLRDARPRAAAARLRPGAPGRADRGARARTRASGSGRSTTSTACSTPRTCSSPTAPTGCAVPGPSVSRPSWAAATAR